MRIFPAWRGDLLRAGGALAILVIPVGLVWKLYPLFTAEVAQAPFSMEMPKEEPKTLPPSPHPLPQSVAVVPVSAGGAPPVIVEAAVIQQQAAAPDRSGEEGNLEALLARAEAGDIEGFAHYLDQWSDWAASDPKVRLPRWGLKRLIKLYSQLPVDNVDLRGAIVFAVGRFAAEKLHREFLEKVANERPSGPESLRSLYLYPARVAQHWLKRGARRL